MKTRKLGWTDLDLTVIGLGTWAIGGGDWEFGWGPQDDEDSVATISSAIEKDVNWIDTAPVYGLGHAEEVVAKAIKKHSKKPIIATKCGLVWDRKRHILNCLKKGSIRSEIEASLKRLKAEAIDLYQIHWPVPDEYIEEAWQEISKAVKEGKVRYAGVSNFTVEQIKRVQSIHPVASLQPPYNMLRRDIENELLGYCAKNNIGVIAYSPMERGLLTGKFSRERVERLPKDDHRRNASPFVEPELSANLALIEKLRPIAERHHGTLAQLAIAWVLRRTEVTAAIVGARRPPQAQENIGAAEWILSKEDIALIDELLREREKKIK